MRVIGITGGICSGKSTATSFFASRGVPVIDADKFGHKTYEKNTSCYSALIEAFGSEIVNPDTQEIDRRVLGSKVFGNAESMKKLTDIVWPEIRRLITLALDEYARNGLAIVVLEAAVMLEAKWQDLVDELWVIDLDSRIATERLIVRNKLSREDAEQRISAQMTSSERCAYANVVIANNGTYEEFARDIGRHVDRVLSES